MRTAIQSRILAATLLAGAALEAGPAFGYGWTTCEGGDVKWNSYRTSMYVSTTSFPAASNWDVRLQNAMWHWNNVKSSGFLFYVGRDTDGYHASGNGINEVYLSSTEVGSALAVTKKSLSCYWWFGWKRGIVEADIAFNSNLIWSTGPYDYNTPSDAPYNFEGVALHELGHALGLSHENRWQSTMNSYYPGGGPLGYYKEWDPLADDRRGAHYLYADGTSEIDIGASALKQVAAGESGLVSSPLSTARGSTATIEYTFDNQGTSRQTFDIGFYLSTNNFISSSDTLLGRNYGAWADPGGIGTFSRTLTIPTWVVPGTYYLGFLIDPDGVIPEANKSNGSQAMPRIIVIQ